MRDEDIPEIRGLELFREVSDTAFDALMRATYLQAFPPGLALFEAGERADFLPVLLEGRVELFGTWSGRRTTIMLIEPVQAVVLAATILNVPYLMSAKTWVKSRIALIPSENVRGIFAQDRAFSTALASELARGYVGAIRQIKNLKLRSGTERLANMLLLRSEGAAGGEFELPVEKRLVASLLGMSPENLSRAFTALRGHGVEVTGPTVRVTSPHKLRRYARSCPLIDDETC
jgi:CRP/FNR family transcriptional regulator, transcriptional activator FtrB